MNRPPSSLSQFIEEYPLYAKFGTDQPIGAADLSNLAFNFFCKHENEVQPFRLGITQQNGFDQSNTSQFQESLSDDTVIEFTDMFTGVCQSCGKYHVNIIINGASQRERPKYFIRKIGQYPAPEVGVLKLSTEISGFLSKESCEFYTRALKNLELGFGAGALAYFSKMIKHEIGRIVEALSNLYYPGGSKIADAFLTYQENAQKTSFIEEITPHLPESLKKHGANILLVLSDAVSADIHQLTEKDCTKRSKDIDTVFRYMIRKINKEINRVVPKKHDKYFLRYS